MRERGRVTSLVDDAAVSAAVTEPPEDTRAVVPWQVPGKFRAPGGGCVVGLGDLGRPGRHALQRVPMLEPLRGTRAHVGEIMDRSPDVTTLLRELDAAAG